MYSNNDPGLRFGSILGWSFVLSLSISCSKSNNFNGVDTPDTAADSVTIITDTETVLNADTLSDFEFDSDSTTDSVIDNGSDSNIDISSDVTSDSKTDTETTDECVHPDVEASCTNGWCIIPHGCYIYGAPPEEPCGVPDLEKQTEVTLTRDFIIAQTEVTQTQWESLGFHNPSASDPPCPECPVGYINWYDTLAYCNALSEKDGFEPCYDLSCCEGVAGEGCPNGDFVCSESTYICSCDVNRFKIHYECPGYRLPTSAEWQYAARAGTTTATYNGDLPSDLSVCAPQEILDPIAWHCGNTDKAMPAAQKQPNEWGLFDMLGNIYEWISDNFDGYSIGHGAERITDPQGIPSSSWSMKNGASWWRSICYVRAGAVIGYPKKERWANGGFRPARTLTFSDTGTDEDTETESADDTERESDSGSETDKTFNGGPDAGDDDQCIAQENFSACRVDTTDAYGVDYDNDICIDETCVSIGACNDRSCNVPGQHFVTSAANGRDRMDRTEPIVGEAVVEDSVTGLFWQGELPALFEGCTLGHPDPQGSQCAWWQAFAYCDGLDWGGYTDWYLPDEYELMSVVDYSMYYPVLDDTLFPNAVMDIFWTSSSYNDEWAWLVSMDMGRLEYLYKDFGAFVRCVRREPDGILERFVRSEPVVGEPVVSDQVVGLTWQGCAAGQVGDIIDCVGTEAYYPGGGAPDSAGAYCEALDWGGFTDWRLPDIKALASLSDHRVSIGATIDSVAFPDTPVTWFWSSTTYVPFPDHAWFLDFASGRANVADQLYGHAVRCVR